MTFEELLDVEIKNFKKLVKGKDKEGNIDFSSFDETNIMKVLRKALNDALAQAARRKKIEYSDNVDAFLREYFLNYFTKLKENQRYDNQEEYKDAFIKNIIKIFNDHKNELGNFSEDGYAYKFATMAFKYLYCFDGVCKENFKFCYLPLDKYTIIWFKTHCNKSSTWKTWLNDDNNAWSNITEKVFFGIQDEVKEILEKELNYIINHSTGETVDLNGKNKLDVEFVVWTQEKINEIRRSILNNKEYIDRIGIKSFL